MCIGILIHMDTISLFIEPSSPDPIYRQIIGQISRMIAAGQCPPGTRLPSVREVAAMHSINPMTVSKAYAQLEAQGLLVRQRGKGMMVSSQNRGAQPLEDRLKALEPVLGELVRQACELDIDIEVLIKALRPMMDKERNKE